MNFQDNIDSIKSWVQEHIPYHHDHCGCHDFDHFIKDTHWYHTLKHIPKELSTEIHDFCLQEHEKFLGAHFQFEKKYRTLKHKADMLVLDVKEHCHEKKDEFNKKIMSESLAELKKVREEMHDLTEKESARFFQVKKDVENKVHDKIQEFLKK